MPHGGSNHAFTSMPTAAAIVAHGQPSSPRAARQGRHHRGQPRTESETPAAEYETPTITEQLDQELLAGFVHPKGQRFSTSFDGSC
ncbi:hypothetical protein PQR15_38315 [Streptomyces lydicus]|nr:hypothetical protein [Streptomyces lydicus]